LRLLINFVILRKGTLISLIDQTIPLIKPPYLLPFIACCALQFGTFFISAGLGLFLPDILNKLSKYRDETCDVGSECVYHVCDVAGFEFHQDKNITVNNEVVLKFNLFKIIIQS